MSQATLRNENDVTVEVRKSTKAEGAFRTISEVADDINVPQHVLRFWETRFFQVRPLKRGGGRRYYRPEDVALIKKIHHLLYSEGYTIKGVQKLLRGMSKAQLLQEQGIAPAGPITEAKVIATGQPANQHDMSVPVETIERLGLNAEQRKALERALSELKAIKSLIAKAA
jgi:DNA-binding transcriptional MerR regulator